MATTAMDYEDANGDRYEGTSPITCSVSLLSRCLFDARSQSSFPELRANVYRQTKLLDTNVTIAVHHRDHLATIMMGLVVARPPLVVTVTGSCPSPNGGIPVTLTPQQQSQAFLWTQGRGR
jgi:hypothetical protein